MAFGQPASGPGSGGWERNTAKENELSGAGRWDYRHATVHENLFTILPHLPMRGAKTPNTMKIKPNEN
jgi:hypothetical protein